MLNKYNQFPCPCPVIENQSLRHFAEMIVSLLAFHGLDPDLLAQYPTALQVIQEWSCRMRTPDPHRFIDGLMALLLADPPSPNYEFTDKLVVRFSAILIFALSAVQAGA